MPRNTKGIEILESPNEYRKNLKKKKKKKVENTEEIDNPDHLIED